MSGRGLRKLTANTLQAREDWEKLACKAIDLGIDFDDPPPQAGWRAVDKRIALLKKKIEQREWRIKRDERVGEE